MPRALRRNDDRVIIHFDYDCFYASVVEKENPALKMLPLAIQQKQIIVTCNYEARKRGLYKLQLITEAKKLCPDVVIVLGEDLTRFRDASKALYHHIRAFSWSDKVERLGFDEVWMDVTDLVDYNEQLLNNHDLAHSFFQLSKDDPLAGFAMDATVYAGYIFPRNVAAALPPTSPLERRLILGSHLAMHIRHVLEEQHDYTCTVGISTSKLLSKLIGNVNKPRAQTTLLPPYEPDQYGQSSVLHFLDALDIGAVPGIGFKLAQKLRGHLLGRAAEFNRGLVYGGSKEQITVGQVRLMDDLDPGRLEKLLAGPGAPHGIGHKVFSLVHGIDDSEVQAARDIPRQISIEDSYIRLDTLGDVCQEMTSASSRLVERMRMDLTESTVDGARWIGRPASLRLSTRPRAPIGADGTRERSFQRISRSAPLPQFVFNLDERVGTLAERLVQEALLPLFKRLHPEKSGWNLSLLNVAVTNMIDVGATSKNAVGRDINSMFARQEQVYRDFRVNLDQSSTGVAQVSEHPKHAREESAAENPADPAADVWQDFDDENDDDDDSRSEDEFYCAECGRTMPAFARTAHARYHQDVAAQG